MTSGIHSNTQDVRTIFFVSDGIPTSFIKFLRVERITILEHSPNRSLVVHAASIFASGNGDVEHCRTLKCRTRIVPATGRPRAHTGLRIDHVDGLPQYVYKYTVTSLSLSLFYINICIYIYRGTCMIIYVYI